MPAATLQVHTFRLLGDFQALVALVKDTGVSVPTLSRESDHLSTWSGLQQSMLQLRGQFNDDARVARMALDSLTGRCPVAEGAGAPLP